MTTTPPNIRKAPNCGSCQFSAATADPDEIDLICEKHVFHIFINDRMICDDYKEEKK